MYWTPRGHCCEDTVAFVTNATALPIPLRESRDGSNCTCPSCMCERMSLTFASSGGKPDAFEIAPVRSGCCCWTIVAGGVAAACRRIVVRALGRGRARRQAGRQASHSNGAARDRCFCGFNQERGYGRESIRVSGAQLWFAAVAVWRGTSSPNAALDTRSGLRCAMAEVRRGRTNPIAFLRIARCFPGALWQATP